MLLLQEVEAFGSNKSIRLSPEFIESLPPVCRIDLEAFSLNEE